MEEVIASTLAANTTVLANPYTHQQRLCLAMFCFCIAVVGTIGNVIAAAALLLDKNLRQNPSTAFMVNLLLSLVPVNALGLPWYGIRVLLEGSFPKNMIIILRVMNLIFIQVHLHTICAVAIIRTLAMMHSHTYKRLMQKRWVAVCLVVIWLYSSLLWLPLYSGVFGDLKYDRRQLSVSLSSDTYDRIHDSIAYGLPLFITSTCYIFMYIKVQLLKRGSSRRHKTVDGVQENDAINHWRNHVTRTILVIFVIFTVCNVPYFIMLILRVDKILPTIWIIFLVIFSAQFCVSPVVYVTVSQEYRRANVHLLRKMLSSTRILKTSQNEIVKRRNTDDRKTEDSTYSKRQTFLIPR
ncbi:protein trapped in endoderm-1-like [Homarus americanus]|uniref:protein trapped in endoderm-1-like n=1 Tax=Homarus americanus TaxID=6706 RepID=UPI001C43B5FF|nr:protein trapped in endoderm-1-like [Homarus americanus]